MITPPPILFHKWRLNGEYFHGYYMVNDDLIYLMMAKIMGMIWEIPSMEGTPIARWCVFCGKIPSYKWMMTGSSWLLLQPPWLGWWRSLVDSTHPKKARRANIRELIETSIVEITGRILGSYGKWVSFAVSCWIMVMGKSWWSTAIFHNYDE